MNGKVGNGAAGGVLACIEGLPPLPKSLSGLLNSSGGSWREMERMYVKKTMIQDDLSRGRNNADNLLANKPANLDAALALLRKEMVREEILRNSCSSGCGRSPVSGGVSKNSEPHVWASWGRFGRSKVRNVMFGAKLGNARGNVRNVSVKIE